MSFGYLEFNSEPDEPGPKRAWYEVSSGKPIDEKISTDKKGTLSFEFHTELEPKNLYRENFASIQNPLDYFISYLVNRTDTLVRFGGQDGSVMMIQEAKNNKGNWTAI